MTRPLRRRRHDGVDRVAVARPTSPVPVAVVAVLTFSQTACQQGLTVESISSGETVMALLANTVCAAVRPEDSLTAAVAVARGAVGVAGARGDAADAVELLLALL